MNKVQKLLARMFAFSEGSSLDSYPGLSCTDDLLIQGAMDEGKFEDGVLMMCFLASEHARTRADYDNAKRYIQHWVEVAWLCNMQEGANPVQQAIDDAA